jgi:hypothetical protein
MLLTGKRCHIYAGNDAHGNFNRFRQVKLPILRLWEREAHLFGRVTTRVRALQPLTDLGLHPVMAAELEFYLIEHDGIEFSPRLPRIPGSDLAQGGKQSSLGAF